MKKLHFTKIFTIVLLLVLSMSCEKEDSPELMELSIKTAPLITTFVEGQTLDLKGLLVKLSNTDGDFENIGYGWFEEKGITTSPQQNEVLTSGIEGIIITHTSTGLSVTQPITVVKFQITDIAIKSEPSKNDYELGETLDLSGLVLTITTNDGNTKDVPFEEFDDFGIRSEPANGSTITFEMGSIIKVLDDESDIVVTFNIVNKGLTVTDIDGNVYPIVKLGDQIWMAENLKVTHYNDGEAIPNIVEGSAWAAIADTDEAYCWFNNQGNHAYGIIYTFEPINTGKLAPEGWHVPSQEEWDKLVEFLGGPEIAGGKLKGGGFDWSADVGTENVGFKGLPAGWRDANGNFGGSTAWGCWWSSTSVNDSRAYMMRAQASSAKIQPNNGRKDNGYSVRCVKD